MNKRILDPCCGSKMFWFDRENPDVLFCDNRELDEETMVRILTEPKNSLVKQYKRLLELDGAELEFEPEALREIARIALRRNMGARGLRAIMENLMEDIMFEVPDEVNVDKCIVTKEDVSRGRIC